MDIVLAISGIVVEVAAAIVIVWKVFTWINKLTDGERCQLRQTMLSTYYRHLETKEIRQYEYENFEMCYLAYKALNGNSFIDKIHEEVKKWKVVS